MKQKIFEIIEKINSPILVLFNNEIVYLNNFFVESFLGEFYFDSSSISKFNNNWTLCNSDTKFHIQAKNTKIKYEGSFLTEFIDFKDGIKESYFIYKIQQDFFNHSGIPNYNFSARRVS